MRVTPPRGARPGPKRRGEVAMRRVLLGNFTICGPSLSKFLLEHPHDAALAAEMHVPLTHVPDWAATFGGLG